MNVVDVGKNQYRNLPFIGGPMDGRYLSVKGDEQPRLVSATISASIEYYDDHRGGLPSEWKRAGGDCLQVVRYVLLPESCGYVLEAPKE